MASVEELKERLARTLRTRNVGSALAVIADLRELEPTDPVWPKRAARLSHVARDRPGELEALRCALKLQIEHGLALDAIASCKAILEIEPDDEQCRYCLSRLHGDSDSDNPEREFSADNDDSKPDLVELAAAQVASLPSASDLERCQAKEPGRAASLRVELANIPLFGDLDPSSLHTLIRRVRVVQLEAGQILFREGDAANSLYVVVEGAVVPIAEGERRRKLAVLERGEFFGEIGLLTKEPRNATVESLVETQLLAIDRRVLWELIEKQPAVAKNILGFLRARLIDRQIRTNLFFAAFPHDEREAIARQFRVIEAQDGQRIIEEGKPPEGLFIVLSGRLKRLDRASGRSIGDHGIGDVLGGMSLVEGRAATTDVVANGKCWLVVLGEARFRRILEGNPRLVRVLRRLENEVGAQTEASVAAARQQAARKDLIRAQ